MKTSKNLELMAKELLGQNRSHHLRRGADRQVRVNNPVRRGLVEAWTDYPFTDPALI
jgi:hypothetical protein